MRVETSAKGRADVSLFRRSVEPVPKIPVGVPVYPPVDFSRAGCSADSLDGPYIGNGCSEPQRPL